MLEENVTAALRRAGLKDKELAFLATDANLAQVAATAVHNYLNQQIIKVNQDQIQIHSAALRSYYDDGPAHHELNGTTVSWQDLLEMDIDQILLTTPRSDQDALEVLVRNRLRHKQILTIKDLLLCNEGVLRSVRNIGVGRLTYIRTQLRLRGLRLTEMVDIRNDEWINPFSDYRPHNVNADSLPYESFLNLPASTVRSLPYSRLRFGSFLTFLPERKIIMRTHDTPLTERDVAQLTSYFERRDFLVGVE
jgi:hypothetical protein